MINICVVCGLKIEWWEKEDTQQKIVNHEGHTYYFIEHKHKRHKGKRSKKDDSDTTNTPDIFT